MGLSFGAPDGSDLEGHGRQAGEVRPSQATSRVTSICEKILGISRGGWKFILLLLVYLHLYYFLLTPLFLYSFSTFLTLITQLSSLGSFSVHELDVTESSLLSEPMHEGYQPCLSPIPAEDEVGASGTLASAPSGRESLMQKDHTVQNLGLNLQMQPGINSTHPETILISQGSLSLENHSDTLTKNSSYLQGHPQGEPSGGNKSLQQSWVT